MREWAAWRAWGVESGEVPHGRKPLPETKMRVREGRLAERRRKRAANQPAVELTAERTRRMSPTRKTSGVRAVRARARQKEFRERFMGGGKLWGWLVGVWL